MEENYSVTVGGKHTGKVIVRRQGLYYHFSCRCSLSGEIMYRLMVTCGTVNVNLGILVPENGGFALDTKQPIKRIGEGELRFVLVPKQDIQPVIFVPISPEEPFAYISRLKRSFLAIRNEQMGLMIDEMQE